MTAAFRVVLLLALAGAAGAAGPLYSPADLEFLQHMIVHHQQALELTALVPSRSGREEFHRFARYLEGSQQAEIDRMRELLEVAAARGLAVPEAHLHGDPPMKGMLSRAQMTAIAAARDAEFERLWLEGMILHHEGALDMALAQQEAQFRSGHQPFGLDVLVDDLLVVQRGEITRMRQWLRDWRLVAPEPAG
jgi:uncharacterized protein (DUF305 family)